MPSVYCNRDDCRYRSLGGWCNLGSPAWPGGTAGGDVSCSRIEQFQARAAEERHESP